MAQAQDAELHPGYLNGTVAFSSGTVLGGKVTAFASGGYSSSVSYTGTNYVLTVEGGHSYRPYVDAIVDVPGTYARLAVNQPNYVSVPVNATVNFDFNYVTANIDASVHVIGGQLTAFNIYSNAGEAGTYFNGRVSRYSAVAYGNSCQFPMSVDTEVGVWGDANVTLDGTGETLTLPLSQKTLAVPATGASVSWTLDLTNLDLTTGTISGEMLARNVVGGSILNYHYYRARGASGTPAYGVSRSLYNYANGPYSLGKLPAGGYQSYLYSYFDAPYGMLYHPYPNQQNRVDVAAGQVTTVNFGGDLGFITGSIAMDGFLSLADLSYGMVYAYGLYNTPTYGGYGYDRIDASGNFDLALTSGPWIPYVARVFAYDGSDPLKPLQSHIYKYDYTRHPSYGGAAVNMVAGATHAAPTFEFSTVETEIIFDVVEPVAGDPEVDIVTPRITASTTEYNSDGVPQTYRYIYAYGASVGQARPALRLVGEPGTYVASASGKVNGSDTSFGSFTLVLEVPVDTPTGTDVVVAPTESVDMVFDNVTTSGITTVVESPIGPAAPSGFKLYVPANATTTVYYNISTTAEFTGSVRVCIDYDDSGIDPSVEHTLRLGHYEGTHWVDITAADSPDTVANVICGITTSFSPFVIMVPEDSDGDGVLNVHDNCPNDANPDQEDRDLDGLGDVCDIDNDNDGIPDSVDNCPDFASSSLEDLDADGLGDVCDDDDDGDLVDDTVDNCPRDANAAQIDFDGDGYGDACDVDDDDDGFLDEDDACMHSAVGAITDDEGCSSEQRLENECPQEGEYRNHGQYVQCVSHEADEQLEIGLISDAEKDAIVSAAAQSDIGKKNK